MLILHLELLPGFFFANYRDLYAITYHCQDGGFNCRKGHVLLCNYARPKRYK
jgi:hypothetical protein